MEPTRRRADDPGKRVELEPFAPYHEGLQWRISRAYYAQRGVGAWLEGDLPFRATNSAPFARQHAVFFDRVAQGEGPFDVLEVGAGLGRFAAAFLTELDAIAPEKAARVRFVVSDLVADNVRDAVRRPPLDALAARVVPAVIDPATGALRTLDGAPLPVRCAMIVANYVCDSTPVRLFRKDGAAFFEKWARLVTDVADGAPGVDPVAHATEPMNELVLETEWRPVDLDARLPPAHAEALRSLAAPYPQATVSWFQAFLDLVAGLRASLAPGGVVVASDFGSCRAADVTREAVRVRYGNAPCHPVNFAMFDAWAPGVGLVAARTDVPLRSLYTVALSEPGFPVVAAAFDEAFVRNAWGEDLLDFDHAARAWADSGHPLEAVRLLRRALALDPRSVGLHHRLGESFVEAGYPELALEVLLAGKALGPDPRWDFEFVLGRACFHLGRPREALAWFRASCERDDHPTTRLNLALAYRDLGQYDAAYAECREAVRLDPEYERARTLLRELGERTRR